MPKYDNAYWEALWSKTIRERGEVVAGRAPSALLRELVSDLEAGAAADAGCGHGAEALWMASRGWGMTALDFSPAALAFGRSAAALAGDEIDARVEWVEADLGVWSPAPASFDLIYSLYVHIPGSISALVQRLATGVKPGGHLLLVGHQPVDPETGKATIAAGQVQVSVAVVDELDSSVWEVLLAEERPRSSATGVDAVILARRVG